MSRYPSDQTLGNKTIPEQVLAIVYQIPPLHLSNVIKLGFLDSSSVQLWQEFIWDPPRMILLCEYNIHFLGLLKQSLQCQQAAFGI